MDKQIPINPFDTPWKIWNEVWRWIVYPYVRVLFFVNRIPWRQGWRFHGVPIIQKHRHSQMTFGPYLQLRSTVGYNPLGVNHPVILSTWRKDATLTIGKHFAMTGGSIIAKDCITIGENVVIGANSTIVDTDFHPLTPDGRLSDPLGGDTAPVVIESDVFIGMNCLILKGVTIGQGSVVGAGSVVTRSVPPHSIVAGNPARLIKEVA